MKRLNPSTGEIFKRGDTRKDGYRFWSYTNRLKTNGFFVEQWYDPENYENGKKLNRKSAKQWNAKNHEAFLERHRAWTKANRDKATAWLAKYRNSKAKRTPNWLNKYHFKDIKDFYSLADYLSKETGVKHHVDHIVPLRGENVSGLHVPWNLQVITAKENMKKGNSHVV